MHILHDNTLTQDNRDKFIYVAGQYGQLVKFYNVEELRLPDMEYSKQILQVNRTNYTIASMYRMFIPQIFSPDIEKVIYLDSDIIVNLDITELWKIDLGDKFLGVVTEVSNGTAVKDALELCRDGVVKEEDYFNSGVLLMNLTLFRKEKNIILNWLNVASKHPKYAKYPDQDALNYYFSTQTVKLPNKFNHFVIHARKGHNIESYREIYHFLGVALRINMNDPFNRLWFKYFIKTPWFNEETINNLYAGFQQLHISFKQTMANLTAIMSGKTRGFFVASDDVDWLKNFFSVRDDEEIIPAENNDSLRKLFDAMNASRGKKIFFVFVPNFPIQILTQAGFVQGRDFLNGLEFLSEAQGVPLYSHPLIKAM